MNHRLCGSLPSPLPTPHVEPHKSGADADHLLDAHDLVDEAPRQHVGLTVHLLDAPQPQRVVQVEALQKQGRARGTAGMGGTNSLAKARLVSHEARDTPPSGRDE